MSLLKFTVVCVAALAICGCDQGQPTPDKQATTAVPAADFAVTKKDAESGDAAAQFNRGVMYATAKACQRTMRKGTLGFLLPPLAVTQTLLTSET